MRFLSTHNPQPHKFFVSTHHHCIDLLSVFSGVDSLNFVLSIMSVLWYAGIRSNILNRSRRHKPALSRSYIAIQDLLPGDDDNDNSAGKKNLMLLENYPLSKRVNGRFVSPWTKETEKKPFTVMRYLIARKQERLELPDNIESTTTIPCVELDKTAISSTVKPHFTWMGHASCYYQTDGIYFLTDPVFSERASFSQYFGPRRFVPPPVDVAELKLDVVMLTHTHYDHMDSSTVYAIGNKALWYTTVVYFHT